MIMRFDRVARNEAAEGRLCNVAGNKPGPMVGLVLAAQRVPLVRKSETPPALIFQPLRPQRTFEEVCARIRDQLAAGALRPGDKLPPERELAGQLGVSRTALREALRSLEIAGIVQLRKGSKGGAFIRPGDPRSMNRVMQDLVHLGAISLDDLTEARLLIQTAVVRLACARATDEDIAAIGANIEHTAEATRLGRHDERLRHVNDFYRMLALATRNEILTMLVDALTEILMRFLRAISGGNPMRDLIESRRRFYVHFRVRDADKAARELEKHLTKVHALLTRAYGPPAQPKRRAALRNGGTLPKRVAAIR
jgi:GntR family transcriptional repressor for pyruvate dehydrogenase complex